MRRLVALLLLATLTLGGCAGLPESGPVVDADVASGVDTSRPSDINVLPPAPDATRVDIAKGFLDAMTASPARIDIAKEFLSETAAAAWDPAAATITYSDKYSPREEGGLVVVRLLGAQRLDRSGALTGQLAGSDQNLQLRLTFEDGQWRIANPPDAMVVPLPWFNQRYRATSLYYFDQSGSILVPQPVFVPRGEQTATTLIAGLLAGPGPDLGNVIRSYLPAGLSLDLSVPISASGLADIQLLGEVAPPSPAHVDRMLAQLAWTLRQEPRITSLQVTIGDQVVQVPGGGTEYRLEDAVAYDPSGRDSSTDLYALRDGVVSVRDGNELVPVGGPFGSGELKLRSVAVNLDATQAAAVSADGTTVLVGPVGAGGAGAARAAAVPVLTSGVDLLPPAWDFAGRVWLVDATPDGAAVAYVVGGRAHRVEVPGVSGRPVKSFLVSRDGTRFVAVVRGTESDDLLLGRIAYSTRGRPEVASTSTLLSDPGELLRIVDIAWTSPTAVSLLVPVVPGEFYEVRTLGVDGAPASATDLSTTVSGRLVGLAGAPDPDVATYGVTTTGLLDLITEAGYGFVGDPPTSIGYVG